MNANIAIDMLGGTSKAAEFFGLTTGAISQWREHGIPKAREQTIRYAHPDIYLAAGGAIEAAKLGAGATAMQEVA